MNSSLLVFERFVNCERKRNTVTRFLWGLQSPERPLVFLSLAVTVEAWVTLWIYRDKLHGGTQGSRGADMHDEAHIWKWVTEMPSVLSESC